MGAEFTIDTLEDMCSLMCDNCIPKRKNKEKDKEDNGKDKRNTESDTRTHSESGAQ
jgi:hypothetical protein